MVSELKRANDNKSEETNGSASLKDLMPKAQDSQIKVIKPYIRKEIDAVVKDVDIKLNTEEFKKDTKDNPYYEGYVTIVTNFINPETQESNDSVDFFGGFRAYVVTDPDSGSVVMDPTTGLGQILRYLPGVPGKRQGALRRVIDAVQKDMTQDEEEEYNDWLSFFFNFLPGKNVRIKSEVTTGEDGKENIKQCIVGIRR